MGQSELIIRPFYSDYKSDLTAHEYRTSFYPLYYSERTNYWSRWSFLFIFGNDSTKHEDTGDDNDLSLGPILQWGTGETEKDRYAGFFPFYGKWKSKLGWSEINFVLFPVYVDWSHKEYKARSLVWPIIMWGGSDTRDDFRVFPFYSHKSHIGKYDHYSVLWPFFAWGKDNLDKKEPSSFSWVWLVYARKKSYYGNMESIGIMPIIGSLTLFSYGYDERSSQKNWSLFFFFLQYGYSNDKDYRKMIFFPFYGHSRYASKNFTFITPFYITMSSDTYHEKTKHYYLVPFFQYSYEYYVKEEREDQYFKVWPLYKWHEDTEGNLSWNLLSLFPARSTTFEKIWDPIWSVVEYRRLINGEKRFSLLMRLYTQRWSEDEFHFYLPLLLDYSNVKGERSWDFLYGFLGYESKENNSRFKFLWLFQI